MDLSGTIAPKSDQLDAVDLLSGPRTFTIAGVSRGNEEQPVQFALAEFPRPWRPGLSMRRVLVSCWGSDAATYVGRRVTLYCDPDVQFGGAAVGGTRIAALSHIDKPKQVPLLIKRGKSAIFTVQPLADAPSAGPTSADVQEYLRQAEAADSLAEWREVWQRAKDAGHLTNELKAELVPLGEALKAPKADPAPESADGWPEVATIPGTDES